MVMHVAIVFNVFWKKDVCVCLFTRLTAVVEQYIETKSHWLPDFAVTRKEGVVEKHQRGPLEEQKY